jgi:hypothetical protein
MNHSEARSRVGTRILFLIAVALLNMLLGAAAAQAACATGSSVDQWQCWEQSFTASTSLGTNPYRDYVIQVTLIHSVEGNLTQDAFWTGGNNFKVRAAFPPGSVTWGGVTCSPRAGGPACPAGLTWTSTLAGTLTVNPRTTNVNLVFDKGFLRQSTFFGYSPLYYWDLSTPFYWNGDTAWSGPGFEASGATSIWSTYISDRRTKGFNVTLVAPAATYRSFAAGTGPFTQISGSGCPSSNPVPNDCSVPNTTYWNQFDNLIGAANGTVTTTAIIPLIAGLVDPLDNGVSGSYPCQSNAVAFSRYLAARMAGNAVMFSPGFDDKPSSTTQCGETLTSVMNAIGAALATGANPASPRAILTNHLGGGLTCSDYQNFRSSIWMSLFLLQSGHGGNLTPADPSDICPKALTSESSVAAALRRSWQMPWTMTDFGANPALPSYSPGLPSYNGEGPYDNICLQTAGCTCPSGAPAYCTPNSSLNPASNYAANVDVRYHERQAAFESLFSDAYGYTYGAQEVAGWYFGGLTAPASYPITSTLAFAGKAAGDMGSIFNNFKTRAGLTAHRDWITNNGPDTATDGNYKRALASDGSSLVLAYMPAQTASADPTIQISTSSIPGLACAANGWTAKWMHAQNNQIATATISCSGTNPLVIAKPPGSECMVNPYDNQACDWVLQIQKTGSASLASQASPAQQGLDVWADTSPADGTSAIYAALAGPPGFAPAAAPVLVSPPGLAFQQSPRVTRVRDGYLVVWHAYALDGSQLGIFAQKLDPHGQPVGGRVQVNVTTDGDQRDPSIDSAPDGSSLVAWTSYGQDGDLAGIYGRLLDASGSPLTGEFQINAVSAGLQEMPQVASLPGGGFAVAWQTRAMDTNQGALSLRVFAKNGNPVTGEVRIPAAAGGVAPRLIDVMPTALGGFRLRWRSGGVPGVAERLVQQELNAAGQAIGPASSLQ